MKRVVLASGYRHVHNHPELVDLRDKIRAGENDISYLESCETLEDVMNHKYELVNIQTLIYKLNASPESETRSILDKFVDDWSYYLDKEISRYVSTSNKIRLFKEYVTKLQSYIDIELEGDYAKIYVDDATYDDHDKLIEMVDTINSVLGSDYHFTGRGGSWTAYDIWTPDKVELQIGLIDEVRDEPNCWGMRIVGI